MLTDKWQSFWVVVCTLCWFGLISLELHFKWDFESFWYWYPNLRRDEWASNESNIE